MKNPFITLTILSSALNMAPALASEIIQNQRVDSHFSVESIYISSIQFTEIPDNILRKEIEKSLSRLISMSKNLESFTKSYNAEELEDAVLSMKEKMTTLDEKYPTVANHVKSKVLAEMLKEGVVIIDENETARFERVQISLNSSIVSQLEDRQGVIRSLAGEGTVCI